MKAGPLPEDSVGAALLAGAQALLPEGVFLSPEATIRVCSIPEDPCEILPEFNVRDQTMFIWGLCELVKGALLAEICYSEFYRFRYQNQHPSPRRRTPVDVNLMIEKWHAFVKALVLAHDKADIDRAEFDSEDYMKPLLDAPVKQLRLFYSGLCDRLKNDPQVPFFLWRAFVIHEAAIVARAKAIEEPRVLKDEVAKQLADLVAPMIADQLPEALAGALRWRGEETLEEVKTAVKSGKKPRLKGRESCLFLEAGDALVML